MSRHYRQQLATAEYCIVDSGVSPIEPFLADACACPRRHRFQHAFNSFPLPPPTPTYGPSVIAPQSLILDPAPVASRQLLGCLFTPSTSSTYPGLLLRHSLGAPTMAC